MIGYALLNLRVEARGCCSKQQGMMRNIRSLRPLILLVGTWVWYCIQPHLPWILTTKSVQHVVNQVASEVGGWHIRVITALEV